LEEAKSAGKTARNAKKNYKKEKKQKMTLFFYTDKQTEAKSKKNFFFC